MHSCKKDADKYVANALAYVGRLGETGLNRIAISATKTNLAGYYTPHVSHRPSFSEGPEWLYAALQERGASTVCTGATSICFLVATGSERV